MSWKEKTTHIKSYKYNLKKKQTQHISYIVSQVQQIHVAIAAAIIGLRFVLWVRAGSCTWEFVSNQPWAMASIANWVKLLASWWLTYPSWNILVSWNDYPIYYIYYGKIKNVPNHQPVSHHRKLFLYSASPPNVSGLLGATLSICVKCMSNGLKLPQFQISNRHKNPFG